MNKLKLNFSIKRIGLFRFYTGIGVGLFFSWILRLFFLYLIRMSDVLAVLSSGYWHTDPFKPISFYSSFFWSLFSISLAFCLTTYIWTNSRRLDNFRMTRLNRIGNVNSLFIFFFVLFCCSRVLQSYIQFNNLDLNLQDELGWLPYLLPVFLFLYNWNYLIRIYKSKKPFLLSILLFIIYGLILSECVN